MSIRSNYVFVCLLFAALCGYAQTEKVAEEEVFKFNVIEEVPVFQGCEDSSDKRRCFQEQLNKHIRKHFRYPEMAVEQFLSGRVYVMFKIDKEGKIVDIITQEPKISIVNEVDEEGNKVERQIVTPDYSLINEAKRIISLIPTMAAPGKALGNPVTVAYSIPITFRLQ